MVYNSFSRITAVFLAGALLLSISACGVKQDPLRPSDVEEKHRKHKILN